MKIRNAGDGKHKRRVDPETPPAPAATVMPKAGYLSFCSRPGASESKPIFFGSNLVGDALLSPWVPGVAASAVTAMASVLPVGLSGIEVRETLHRLDADAQPPTLDRGVLAENRVGEPLGTLTMRWRLAPDPFEATSGTAPPDTEIQRGRSQRFVMQDGVITLEERGHGALRFFGAGRTYPVTTDGQTRLLCAGTAVIVEGTGSLKGIRGTLMISGEVLPLSAMTLTVVGHIDAGGPISVEETLEPLSAVAGADTPATVLTLVGESDESGVERIRFAWVGNDLANTSQLRSAFHAGAHVGSARGPLPFDSADRRCAVPLANASRELSFADEAGRHIGTITAGGLEGTAFPDVREGQALDRVVAYGVVTHGTGALAGATGVLTFEAAVEPSGRTTTLYALRLVDPAGRFRPPSPEAHATPPPAPAETLRFVDGGSITNTDRAILEHADRTMTEGVELVRWWESKDRSGDYAERFDVVREFNDSGRSFGFFDTATISNAGVPVMGIVQEMFYDRQKEATGEHVRDQVQAFILQYFMRVCHLRQPEAVPTDEGASANAVLKMLSWQPDASERHVGFGYQQLYYKLRESGEIGKFTRAQQPAIVDLREIGEVYDWILLKVDIFDFNLSFAPFGAEAPKLQMPLKESTYLVLGPPFVKNVDHPEPGVLGRYGFGYAFLPYAPEGPGGVIAYGPGHFAAAIQTVDFSVMDDGEIRVRAAFVVNRPDRIMNVDVAPVDWSLQLADMMSFGTASRLMSPVKAVADRLPLRVDGVDPLSSFIWMANMMTFGLAASRLGISKEVLERKMLLQHFMQHYEMLNSSLLVWRMVPDWTDHEHLPARCREGAAV